MARKVPIQKPGHSKQDYTTPKEFLEAVKKRLHISEFAIDLAASAENTVAEVFYTEEDDSLRPELKWDWGGWAWLNPPFAHIEPWVKKAMIEAHLGAHIAMLVPASVGANWWGNFVEPHAYQVFLNGRLCFIPDWKEQGFGSPPLYPKDCALLLYTPWGFLGHEVWNWRAELEGGNNE
jgi:phage N-6-adenine-methyltransferase